MKEKNIILHIQELNDILKIQQNHIQLLQEEILETEFKLKKFKKKLVKKNVKEVIR